MTGFSVALAGIFLFASFRSVRAALRILRDAQRIRSRGRAAYQGAAMYASFNAARKFFLSSAFVLAAAASLWWLGGLRGDVVASMFYAAVGGLMASLFGAMEARKQEREWQD